MTYGGRRRAGRLAFDEDAARTSIFHALNRGGWPGRRPPGARPADAVDEFRRDPLTAPIPVQAVAAAAASSVLLARAARACAGVRGRAQCRRAPYRPARFSRAGDGDRPRTRWPSRATAGAITTGWSRWAPGRRPRT